MFLQSDFSEADLFSEYVDNLEILFQENKVLNVDDALPGDLLKNSNENLKYASDYVHDELRNQFLNRVRNHYYNKIFFDEHIKTYQKLNSQQLTDSVVNNINSLYIDYKGFISQLREFYYLNPGFKALLLGYPRNMQAEFFFEFLLDTEFFLEYNGNNKEIYFKMLYKIFSARFIELDENELKTLQKEMHRYTEDENTSIADIASEIYNNVSKREYLGVLCPDNLAFIPLMDKEMTDEITSLLIKYVFIAGTSKELISDILLHRVNIVDKVKKSTSFSFPYQQNAPIMENKKLGYLVYAIRALNEADLIRIHRKKSNYGIYKKLSKKRLFKVNKLSGEPYYPTRNDLKSAISRRYLRYYNYNNIEMIREKNIDFWNFMQKLEKIIN